MRGSDAARGRPPALSVDIGGNVPREIHGVMEDADDLNHVIGGCSIHDHVPAAATAPSDVERTKPRPQFVARDAPGRFRTVIKRADRGKDRGFVDLSLTRAENVESVGEDTDEILFGLSAEDYAPWCVAHERSAAAARAFAPTVLR